MTIYYRTRKFLKNIYYIYFAKIQYHTVHLRGGLNDQEQKYLDSHSALLKASKNIFKNFAKEDVLEIGFGNASHLEYLGQFYRKENLNIYGVEMDKVCVLKALKKIDENNFTNVKIIQEDARLVVANAPRNYFAKIFVLFPDPWRKKKDHKKRLLNKNFLIQLLTKIKNSGEIILASDWENYCVSIEEILKELKKENLIVYEKYYTTSKFDEVQNPSKYSSKNIFQTKFALRALKEGRAIVIFSVRKFLL